MNPPQIPMVLPATYEVARGLLTQAYGEPGHGGQVSVEIATGRITLSLDAASRLLHKLLDD